MSFISSVLDCGCIVRKVVDFRHVDIICNIEFYRFQETENLIRDFRHRYDIMMESSKQKIEDFRQAACEVRELHEFYPDPNLDRNNQGDNNSLVYLTDVEVREIIEIDEMLDRFEHFYDRPST